MIELNTVTCGDSLTVMKDIESNSIDSIITSPPYWGMRDYGEGANKDWNGWYGQLGLEPSLDLYIEHLLEITLELKRVLKKTGTMFWNHGDAYASKGKARFDKNKYGGKSGLHSGRARTSEYTEKCLLLQNFRLVLRMIDEQGWVLRNTIPWIKPNSMPSPVQDRYNNTYEPVFFFTKSKKYYFNLDAVREPHKTISLKRVKGNWNGHREPMSSYLNMDIKKMCHPLGKNPGDVWNIATQSCKEAHFATFPIKLVYKALKAGCPEGGVVLDPFSGVATTGFACQNTGRDYILIEISPEYCEIARARLKDNEWKTHNLFNQEEALK